MSGPRLQTLLSAAGYRIASLNAHTVSQSCLTLPSLAETGAGIRLKNKLEKVNSIIASGSHPRDDLRPAKPHAPADPFSPKSCVKADTADLHRDQGSWPQDSSVVLVQQQCGKESSDALLPAAHSLLPTSGGIAEGTAHNTDLSLYLDHSSI